LDARNIFCWVTNWELPETIQKLDEEGEGEGEGGTQEKRKSGAMANCSSISFVSGDDLEVLQGPKVAVIDVR
jgi:hypothetical protein